MSDEEKDRFLSELERGSMEIIVEADGMAKTVEKIVADAGGESALAPLDKVAASLTVQNAFHAKGIALTIAWLCRVERRLDALMGLGESVPESVKLVLADQSLSVADVRDAVLGMREEVNAFGRVLGEVVSRLPGNVTDSPK